MPRIFETIGTPGKRDYDTAKKTLMLKAFREEHPIFELLEFISIVGRADTKQKKSAAQGGRTRTINNGFPNNVIDPAFANIALKIYGDEIRTDKAHDRSAEGLSSSQHLTDLEEFGHSLARMIVDDFINGDTGSSVEQFDGLKAQTPAGNTNTLKADNDTDGLLLLPGNSDAAVKSQHKLAEALGAAIQHSKANFGLANADIIERSKLMIPKLWTTKTVGSHEVDFYRGVPIFSSGWNSDESEDILPFSETVGATDDCSSVYVGKLSKRDLALATTIGLDVSKTREDGNFIVTDTELDIDLVRLSNKCVERVAGLRLG